MGWFTKVDSKTGYLPDEQPPFWKLLLYALQQVIVMFPATITVALITNFHISTTIFASGCHTLFHLVPRAKFRCTMVQFLIYRVFGLLASEHLVDLSLDSKISIAFFGIVIGLVSIAAGFYRQEGWT